MRVVFFPEHRYQRNSVQSPQRMIRCKRKFTFCRNILLSLQLHLYIQLRQQSICKINAFAIGIFPQNIIHLLLTNRLFQETIYKSGNFFPDLRSFFLNNLFNINLYRLFLFHFIHKKRNKNSIYFFNSLELHSYFFNFYSLSLKIFNIECRFFRRFYIKKNNFHILFNITITHYPANPYKALFC